MNEDEAKCSHGHTICYRGERKGAWKWAPGGWDKPLPTSVYRAESYQME
jgi:hypothetical protein